MSVVVDTSVWSHFLRRSAESQDPQKQKLESLIRGQQHIVLLGVVLQEILQGVRDMPSFEKLKDYLGAFPLLEMQREDYIEAARLGNLCRSKGVQVSVVDSQIAAVCIGHNCDLLTCDQDFQHIARYCPLQLI